jgi:hypothetical protein
MKSVLPALAVCSAASLFSGCVVVDSQAHITREEKRFTVSGAPDLTLTTFDGSITIRAGDAPTVLVEIEKRGPTQEDLAELRVETKQDGDHITVEVKRPSREKVFFGIGTSPHARLIVTMPRHGNVTAKTGDGAVDVHDVRGRIDVRTGDGSIRGEHLDGAMTLATGDGAVTLESVRGDLDIDTGDGSISVTGTLGVVKLHTSDGAISFRAEAGTVMKDDWSITTGDGSVSLFLPSDFAAQLDAHTGDGRIRNDLKPAAEADDGESSRREVRTKLGAGGKTLRIRTGDGGIRLQSN